MLQTTPSTPAVCPNCGHCPTCGQTNTDFSPPWTIDWNNIQTFSDSTNGESITTIGNY